MILMDTQETEVVVRLGVRMRLAKAAQQLCHISGS